MPDTARQFEPHITRSGGVPLQYRFTVRCSECPKADHYESNRPIRDDVVKGHFKEHGWLLGRDRSYDLCPDCLAGSRDTGQRRIKDTARQSLVMTARKSDREAAPKNARHRDTADILARHLGKPEALAAEVFRPKEAQPQRSPAPSAMTESVKSPALSPEVEQALTGMAADLKSLRSTMELMAEQVSKLVTLGGQQIEAIARLAPLMIQSAEGISGRVRDVVSAVQTLSPPSALTFAQEPVSAGEIHSEQQQDVSSEPEPVQAPEVPANRIQRSAKTEGPARKAASAQVVVKSIPDAKRPDRFYTTIRVPRDLWDRAGFGPEDRIQIDWKKKTLSITRVLDGGVKPKSIGDAVVVLQSWRLGDLTFDPAKVTAGEGTLRLTSP
jgi:hypothetical protein